MGERTESELQPDEGPRRPACPMCGSTRTQPFTHAGLGARDNMSARTAAICFAVRRSPSSDTADGRPQTKRSSATLSGKETRSGP